MNKRCRYKYSGGHENVQKCLFKQANFFKYITEIFSFPLMSFTFLFFHCLAGGNFSENVLVVCTVPLKKCSFKPFMCLQMYSEWAAIMPSCWFVLSLFGPSVLFTRYFNRRVAACLRMNLALRTKFRTWIYILMTAGNSRLGCPQSPLHVFGLLYVRCVSETVGCLLSDPPGILVSEEWCCRTRPALGKGLLTTGAEKAVVQFYFFFV